MRISSIGDLSIITSSGVGDTSQNTTTYFGLNRNTIYYFKVKISTHLDFSYSSVISTNTRDLQKVWIAGFSEDTVRADWGDFDNDNDLDILLANDGVNRVYRNDGNNVFTSVWVSPQSENSVSAR